MKTVLVLLLLRLPTSLAAEDVARKFEPFTPYEALPVQGHGNVTHMYVRQVPRGTGNTTSVELPVVGGTDLVIWSATKIQLYAPTSSDPSKWIPAGEVEDFAIAEPNASELGLAAGQHYVRRVVAANPGSYRLEVEMPDGTAPGVVVAVAEPGSSVTLFTTVFPLSQQPHEPITVQARLWEDRSPIRGAKVIARLASPEGETPDTKEILEESKTQPGLYEKRLSSVQQPPGIWEVFFDAEGTTRSGHPFARSGSNAFVVEPGIAHLRNASVKVVNDNFVVVAQTDVMTKGTYSLDVVVVQKGLAIAWAQGERKLVPGSVSLPINIPVAFIDERNDLRFDVRLVGLDPIGVAGQFTATLP
jgi:hypothetical protein